MSDTADMLEAALEARVKDMIAAALPPGDSGDGLRLPVAAVLNDLRTLHRAVGDQVYTAHVHGLVAEIAVIVGMEHHADAEASQ